MKYNLSCTIFLLFTAIVIMVHSSWATEDTKAGSTKMLKKVEHLGQSYAATFPVEPKEIELNTGALELNARTKGKHYIVSAVPKTEQREGPQKLDHSFLTWHRNAAAQSGFWTVVESRVYNEDGIDKAHIVLAGEDWVRHLLFVDLPAVGFVVEATIKGELAHEQAEEFLQSFHLVK